MSSKLDFQLCELLNQSTLSEDEKHAVLEGFLFDFYRVSRKNKDEVMEKWKRLYEEEEEEAAKALKFRRVHQ